VVTFYSYKGGVGRSMALANVAALLARWGRRVLIIDWDLEAPGIEDAKPAFGSTNPMGIPWVEPSDITDAVMFLLSDKARYISGEALSISAGGMASNAT